MHEHMLQPLSRAQLQAAGDVERVVMGADPAELVRATLAKEVIGQEEAVAAVAEFIVEARSRGTIKPSTPDSFLFLGPTGVGKTELVKTAAKVLGWPLIPIKGTELSTAASVNRLKGSDPTMVGYGDKSLITPSMLKEPAVVLVDEGEKMHKDVRQWWMEVMEDGVATIFAPTGNPSKSGSKGEEIAPIPVNFGGSAIFFTSNEGAGQMADEYRNANKPLGFPMARPVEDPRRRLKQVAITALETGTFREQPEFLGRIGTKVVFDFLQPEHYSAILDKFISQQLEELARTGIPVMVQPTLELREAALKQAGGGPYGARDLRTYVRNIFREIRKYRVAGSLTPDYIYYADMTDEGTLTLHRLRKTSQPLGVFLPDGSLSPVSMEPATVYDQEIPRILALPPGQPAASA